MPLAFKGLSECHQFNSSVGRSEETVASRAARRFNTKPVGSRLFCQIHALLAERIRYAVTTLSGHTDVHTQEQ